MAGSEQCSHLKLQALGWWYSVASGRAVGESESLLASYATYVPCGVGQITPAPWTSASSEVKLRDQMCMKDRGEWEGKMLIVRTVGKKKDEVDSSLLPPLGTQTPVSDVI